MTNKEILQHLFTAAELYHDVLLDRDYLFVGHNKSLNKTVDFEATFPKKAFPHLLGLKPVNMNSSIFFDLALRRRLSPLNYTVISETELKLDVIRPLMCLPFKARMMGFFNNSGNYLYTDRIIGKTTASMGFVFDVDYANYVPNTTLKEDIRKITDQTYTILATFGKKHEDALYPSPPVYQSEYMIKYNIQLPNYIRERIEP